jgi:hypothetical protein
MKLILPANERETAFVAVDITPIVWKLISNRFIPAREPTDIARVVYKPDAAALYYDWLTADEYSNFDFLRLDCGDSAVIGNIQSNTVPIHAQMVVEPGWIYWEVPGVYKSLPITDDELYVALRKCDRSDW